MAHKEARKVGCSYSTSQKDISVLLRQSQAQAGLDGTPDPPVYHLPISGPLKFWYNRLTKICLGTSFSVFYYYWPSCVGFAFQNKEWAENVQHHHYWFITHHSKFECHKWISTGQWSFLWTWKTTTKLSK